MPRRRCRTYWGKTCVVMSVNLDGSEKSSDLEGSGLNSWVTVYGSENAVDTVEDASWRAKASTDGGWISVWKSSCPQSTTQGPYAAARSPLLGVNPGR